MFNKSKSQNSSKCNNHDEFSPVSTIIGPDVTFASGIFKGSGSVSLHGKLECTVEICGSIRIEDDGIIEGSVYATEVIVEGKVQGDISASHCMIAETGQVLGNVTCARLSVDEGGLFGGRCEMQKDYAPTLVSPNAGQVKPVVKFPKDNKPNHKEGTDGIVSPATV